MAEVDLEGQRPLRLRRPHWRGTAQPRPNRHRDRRHRDDGRGTSAATNDASARVPDKACRPCRARRKPRSIGQRVERAPGRRWESRATSGLICREIWCRFPPRMMPTRFHRLRARWPDSATGSTPSPWPANPMRCGPSAFLRRQRHPQRHPKTTPAAMVSACRRRRLTMTNNVAIDVATSPAQASPNFPSELYSSSTSRRQSSRRLPRRSDRPARPSPATSKACHGGTVIRHDGSGSLSISQSGGIRLSSTSIKPDFSSSYDVIHYKECDASAKSNQMFAIGPYDPRLAGSASSVTSMFWIGVHTSNHASAFIERGCLLSKPASCRHGRREPPAANIDCLLDHRAHGRIVPYQRRRRW